MHGHGSIWPRLDGLHVPLLRVGKRDSRVRATYSVMLGREEVATLRMKFEADKKRIEQMRQQRKFKPF